MFLLFCKYSIRYGVIPLKKAKNGTRCHAELVSASIKDAQKDPETSSG